MANYRRDFTKGGIYFFTIVLQDRTKDYLVRYIDIFRLVYKKTVERYPFETLAICILPDHFHLIMQLPENDHNYSIRISFLKSLFSKSLPKECRKPNESQVKSREAGIWQRRFWEHLIRDNKDLENHMDYIYYNPVKHNYVNSVQDWIYSSFHRDVEKGIYPKDWGSNILPNIKNLYIE
ncbi:MAG: transposase [Pasteurellaceae bacterium]|nr:transposase [Pasteurellaceae bacterium]